MLKRDIQQPSCDQFQNRVSADQCHMTVLQAQVYSVQLTHRGDMFFHSFLLSSYGIQVITGSANFTSEIHFYKFPLGFWP